MPTDQPRRRLETNVELNGRHDSEPTSDRNGESPPADADERARILFRAVRERLIASRRREALDKAYAELAPERVDAEDA
ncbi:MAG: hypothetical protein AAF682_04720 [Planctomycetota bacterium]